MWTGGLSKQVAETLTNIGLVPIFWILEADLCYCLQEAPNKEALEKHHSKFNLKCEWITEVTMAKR